MKAARRVRTAFRRWRKRRTAEGQHRRQAIARWPGVISQVKALGLKLADGGPRHILFVVVDCLRADHLSLHGYSQRTSPTLDAWAREATWFDDCVAASSWTYPSVASLLTGLHPHRHGAVYLEPMRDFNLRMMPRRLREDVLTLPEILATQGYATYLGTGIATAELSVRGRFQTVKSVHLADAARVFDDYLAWRGPHEGGRTFGYLQLSNLHDPLSVPPDWRDRLGSLDPLPDLERWAFLADPRPGEADFERYRRNRIKLYDAALHYVDARLGELLARLPAGTLTVFTADHGEEMWDHVAQEQQYFYDPRPAYGAGHAHNMWHELLHVPLLLHGPGLAPGLDRRPVSLVDLMPTVLDLVGVTSDSLGLDGCSLLGDVPADRTRLAEDVSFGYEKKAVLSGNHKLLVSEGDGVEWVFDLARDPGETTPLALPDVAAELRAFLPRAAGIAGARMTPDEQTAERLRALGYFE